MDQSVDAARSARAGASDEEKARKILRDSVIQSAGLGPAEKLEHRIAMIADALRAEREADVEELRSILASTADRLNVALREANQGEIIGSPYRSFAIRHGIVSLYDWGAALRSELATERAGREQAERECRRLRDAVLDLEARLMERGESIH